MTRKELAKKSKVPERTIRAYETGQRDIKKASAYTVYKLLVHLSKSPIDFVLNYEELMEELNNEYGTLYRTC